MVHCSAVNVAIEGLISTLLAVTFSWQLVTTLCIRECRMCLIGQADALSDVDRPQGTGQRTRHRPSRGNVSHHCWNISTLIELAWPTVHTGQTTPSTPPQKNVTFWNDGKNGIHLRLYNLWDNRCYSIAKFNFNFNLTLMYQFKFCAVGSSTQAFRHSFAVRTVGDWNSLPSHVVEQSTAASFKAELSRLTSAAYAPWSGTPHSRETPRGGLWIIYQNRNALQELNILSCKQTKYCRKLARLNSITYASRIFSVEQTVVENVVVVLDS